MSLGLKVILKVVEPEAAIKLEGIIVTLKSVACVPDIVI